jgi:hypothetical protein
MKQIYLNLRKNCTQIHKLEKFPEKEVKEKSQYSDDKIDISLNDISIQSNSSTNGRSRYGLTIDSRNNTVDSDWYLFVIET